LESGEIFPLKSTWPKNLDIRVIAATNMDLKEEREGHQFRRDLYFRLQQVEINIPPLRERKDDIIPLVEHFISINNITFSKQVKEVDEQAQELLLRYQWPGNVRELKNTIEEIMAFISGTKINIEHLPSRLLEDQKFALPENSVMTLQDLEKKYIRRILALTGYNIQKTAKLLGIGRPSLYRKMEKYKLEKMK
jgi:transcriptional regulator with PAS, ATPase and Fis domain